MSQSERKGRASGWGKPGHKPASCVATVTQDNAHWATLSSQDPLHA